MNAKKILTAVCAVVIFNCFSAIAGSAQTNTVPAPIPPTVSQPSTSTTAPVPVVVGDDTADRQLSAQRQNEKYRLGFQDTVEIQVFKHPELSRVANISPDGTILMPRIEKPIIAVCKTERELGEIIGTMYKNYLVSPFVTVRVVEQLSQPFAVIGAVEKPGSFYLNRRIRLLSLLSLAGGPLVEKSGAKIQVARVGNVSGCTDPAADGSADKNDDVVFLTYRINDVMKGTDNPWMEPGDIVSVLEAEEAYVVGNVIKPTKISLKEPVTLTQAIAIGGGLAPEAKTAKVTIQRQTADSPSKTEMIYDLKDIRDKKIQDPLLQANDIVEVPKDGVKSFRNGVVKALTGGIPSILYRFP